MIPAKFYGTIFLYSIIVMTLFAVSNLSNQSYTRIKNNGNTLGLAIIISIVLAIFLGSRPISPLFGDTGAYEWTFRQYQTGDKVYIGDESEWLWVKFVSICALIMDSRTFFILVDLCYFGFTLWACKKFCPNNVLVAMLFMIGAFSFYTYGTNGIRNGLACSLTLAAISFLCGPNRRILIATVLAFCAINIHNSTLLPISVAVIAYLWIKNFRYAYLFWVLSILISLTIGGSITSLFESLGFGNRSSYFTTYDSQQFSHSSFRWDFLVYSMMPILLGYYVVIKKGIEDKQYMLLLNTYTLANAFWVMVIRANFSNRFAYLSWFMYPIVLAYPLLKLDIWGNQQGKRASQIMLAHIAFTWFMQTLYW